MLILTGPAYPLRGGIAHFNGNLAEQLQRREALEVVTFTRQYPRLLFPGTGQDDTSGEPLVVESHRLLDSIGPRSWWRTARWMAERKPRAVIFAWWQPFFGPGYGMVARLVKRWCGARIVALAHNVVPHERSAVDAVLARFFFRACDHVVLLSRQTEEELESLMPGMARTVLFHPIYDFYTRYPTPSREEARSKLGLPEEAKVALFFGLVRKYKGILVLLEAMGKVTSGARLVVAGEFYDSREEAQALARGLGERVLLHDWYIPNEDVPVYFQAADVVILPYLHASQSGSGSIAAAFGKPVVASRVGGFSEMVREGENGLLVAPGDPAALAAGIDAFFSAEGEEKLKAGAKKLERDWSWERFGQGVWEIL